MKRPLETIADAWGAVERYAAAVVLIVMTAIYGFNVLVRTLAPTYASLFAWIDEAARYLMVWVVFLAVGVALEAGRHVSVDLARGRFGARAERWLFAAIDLVGLVFSVTAAVLALQLTLFVLRSGQTSPTLGLPIFVLYLAPFVGFVSLAFRFVLRLIAVRDPRRRPVAAKWLGDGQP